MYLNDEFCYAAIKVTERQTEETEELLRDLFDSEESKAIKRKIDCKVIMYNECKEDDKCNNDECNKSYKN